MYNFYMAAHYLCHYGTLKRHSLKWRLIICVIMEHSKGIVYMAAHYLCHYGTLKRPD